MESGLEWIQLNDEVTLDIRFLMEYDGGQGKCWAMESHVELVKLYRGVTLDIRVLMEYSGQERCKKVMCESDTAHKYREQLRTWTKGRNWEVTDDDDDSLFFIERM